MQRRLVMPDHVAELCRGLQRVLHVACTVPAQGLSISISLGAIAWVRHRGRCAPLSPRIAMAASTMTAADSAAAPRIAAFVVHRIVTDAGQEPTAAHGAAAPTRRAARPGGGQVE